MKRLEQHFERKTRPLFKVLSIVGWFSYSHGRVEHFFVTNNRLDEDTAVCLCGGYYIRPHKGLNKDPYAKIPNKCKTCVQRIKTLNL